MRLTETRYSLTVRRRWHLSVAVHVDYRGRSTEEPAIARAIRAAADQTDGLVVASYARRGDQDTLEVIAEASESRAEETRVNDGLLDQVIKRLDDAVRAFGDEYERHGPTDLRHQILRLATRDGRTRSIEGTSPTESQVAFTLGHRLRAATSDATRLVSDVREAVEDRRDTTYSHKPLADVDVKRAGDELAISSTAAPHDAESLARVLLRADLVPNVPQRRIDRFVPPPTKYWSIGTLVLLALSLGIAFLPLARGWLVAFAAVTAVIASMSLYLAHRDGALVASVAVGLAIPVVVVGYAIAYGFAMLGRHPAISNTSAGHLVDPVLLSFAIATTAGFLDFGLRELWVRIAAYSEMLLVVSIAGSSAYSLARSAWSRLSELLGRRG